VQEFATGKRVFLGPLLTSPRRNVKEMQALTTSCVTIYHGVSHSLFRNKAYYQFFNFEGLCSG